MAIVGEAPKALGLGSKKIYAELVSVKDGDTVDTGLKTIDAAVATSTTAGHIATVSASGGTLTVNLQDNAGNAITTAEPVFIIAIGE